MIRLTTRRVVSGSVLALVAGLVPGLALTSAHAEPSGTLTVVGTSDVWDSNLMESVIIPKFEAYYQHKHGTAITLNYIHTGTGQAIATAEANQASGLLVHAASLENQFVKQGYSLEKYGRAIFWGDYVLLGPASDPAGVLKGRSHGDIVRAFKKIATAGAAGKAEFVSRGSNPGTTIQEHAIWALTSGVPSCTVPDVDGGGKAPSNTPGACPALSTLTPIDYPSWYHATGLTQALNIEAADSCNFGAPSNDCYVFTDRGTFDFLKSTNALTKMGLVVDHNDQASAAQQNLLVNSFHLYALNPQKFTPDAFGIRTGAMKDLLNWVTSPAGQSAVEGYLQKNGDEPFRPSARPAVTASPLPKKVKAHQKVTIKGSVKNVVPGTPALNGIRVWVQAFHHGKRTTVAHGKTNAKGKFVITFTPKLKRATYRVVTPKRIEKIENSTLKPKFGDILEQSALRVGTMKVKHAGRR
ncbi:MAG TPA: substrate-binding domain-containing protein [Nocardioides sp.]|nr:substrate-binding domain-containing protein [Nocardioides sp.]